MQKIDPQHPLLQPSGKICIKCGADIPVGRARLYPDAVTCVEHSSEQKMLAFQQIDGKTGHSWQALPAQQAEQLHQLQKRKGTGVSRGVKMHRKGNGTFQP